MLYPSSPDPVAAALPLLIEWFAKNRRSLPWREDPSPYHTWLSEIMLQQTRIEAVIPYYVRFLAALPEISDLAAADEEKLMKLWQGLGYYSRARNLKKAAGVICADHGGKLPADYEKLKKLPGIGEYTAGAIASIAFGLPEPAVDGNVLRVIMRLTACGEDITQQTVKTGVASRLRSLYPSGKNAGLLTQSIMELGQTVCIPNGTPDCAHCPLNLFCAAYLSGTVEHFPVKSGKKPRRREEKTVFLLSCDGKLAIRKRPPKGLLADLWEFPSLPGSLSPDAAAAAVGAPVTPVGNAGHIFTHIEWQMTGYAATLPSPDPGYVWVEKERLFSDYAVPSAFRFFLSFLKEHDL